MFEQSSTNFQIYFWVGLILSAIICGFLSANIAEKKGHNSTNWGLCGFFFGIFGLIAAAGLPIKQRTIQTKYETQKKCPDCTEFINKEAYVCKYCGHRFSKAELIAENVPSISSMKEDEQLMAIEAVKMMSDKPEILNLIKVFKEGSMVARLWAIDAIKKIGDKRVIPYLILELQLARYNSPDYSELLDKITEAIKETIDASAIPHLTSVIEKGGYGRKTEKILEILGELGEPAMPTLINILKNKKISGIAAATIEKNIGFPAIPYLNKAIEEDESLRKIAGEILKSINKS